MKIIIVSIVVIIGIVFISRPVLCLYDECAGCFYKKAFLDKYELEDFSQFKKVNVFKRGGDENDQILAMDVSYFVNDTSKTGCYIVTLDKKKHYVTKAKWATEYHVDSDTAKLQQLAQIFMRYEIYRLTVDVAGNIFVYLKDIETLALVQFANEEELKKRSKETKWINIKSNWYKRK